LSADSLVCVDAQPERKLVKSSAKKIDKILILLVLFIAHASLCIPAYTFYSGAQC